MIERPALAAVLAALTGVPAEDFRDRRISLAGAGVFRAPQSFPGLETFAPWITADPAEAWEILVTAGLLGEDPRRTFDVYAHVVDGEIYRAPDGSVRIPGGDVGFEVRAIAEPGADEVRWAIRRGALGRKVAIPRPLLERGRVVDVVTESLRSLARQWPYPATIADLVAVASLGPMLHGAEELCRRIAPELATLGYAVDPCERVVWRVSNEVRRVRGGVVGQWPTRDGDALLTADGTLDAPNGFASMRRNEIPALRALWDMGITLAEDVGAECVLCVPPIGADAARPVYGVGGLRGWAAPVVRIVSAPLRKGDIVALDVLGRAVPVGSPDAVTGPAYELLEDPGPEMISARPVR